MATKSDIDTLKKLEVAISIILDDTRKTHSLKSDKRRDELSRRLRLEDSAKSDPVKRLLGAVKKWKHLTPLVTILTAWTDGLEIRRVSDLINASRDAIHLLRLHVQSWDRLLSANSSVAVRVAMTPLFSYRLWPHILNVIASVSPQMQSHHDPNDIEVESDVEPDRLLFELERDGIWDVAVGYGEASRINSLNKIPDDRKCIFPMRRCLLLPSGTLARVGDVDEMSDRETAIKALEKVLDGKSLAVLESFETIHGQAIADLLSLACVTGKRLIRKPTSLELHSFVRAGRGACLTTYEAQGETDARFLESFALNAHFGVSSMIVVKRQADDLDGNRSKRIDHVFNAMNTYLKKYDERVSLALSFQKLLQQFTHCYISASTQLESDQASQPNLGLHFWRGRIGHIQVQATLDTGMDKTSLCMSADYELFGATESEIRTHRLPRSVGTPLLFHLFGRLSRAGKSEDDTWQLSLRGAAESNGDGDVFQAYLMFRTIRTADGGLAISPVPMGNTGSGLVVGHWIGNVGDNTSPVAPDGGVVILWRNELSAEQLSSIVDRTNQAVDGFSLKLNPSWHNSNKPIPLVGVPSAEWLGSSDSLARSE